MAKLDDKYITVESEAPDFPVTVTEQPVEKDINLVDHVQAGARTLSLSGLIVGDDAGKTMDYILSAKDKGQIVKYVGRITFSGIITSFSTGYDYKVADGMTFNMELREVRIATSSYVGQLPTPVKAQADPVVNKGTQQPKNKSAAKSKKTQTKKQTVASKPDYSLRPTRAPIKPGSKWGTGNLL